MTKGRSWRPGVVLSAVIDVVLVLAFVVLGRSFHGEAIDVPGVLATAWPFIAGLAIAWIVTRAWRSPGRIVRPGVGIWIVTVAAGMLLRFVSGQGVALSFVIVAAVTTGILLLGWRALARLVSRRAKVVSSR